MTSKCGIHNKKEGLVKNPENMLKLPSVSSCREIQIANCNSRTCADKQSKHPRPAAELVTVGARVRWYRLNDCAFLVHYEQIQRPPPALCKRKPHSVPEERLKIARPLQCREPPPLSEQVSKRRLKTGNRNPPTKISNVPPSLRDLQTDSPDKSFL